MMHLYIYILKALHTHLGVADYALNVLIRRIKDRVVQSYAGI